MRKIIEAEIMSKDQTPLRITLSTGEVIEGFSWGIMPEFDDECEELDSEILAFKSYSPQGYYPLSDDDIVKIEKGSNLNGILPYTYINQWDRIILLATLVSKLQADGVESTPYHNRNW